MMYKQWLGPFLGLKAAYSLGEMLGILILAQFYTTICHMTSYNW